jgi:hypothetical protein
MVIKNAWMTLITAKQYEALVKAGYKGTEPIVKLFMGPLTWLVTGIEDDILYGWADLSMQCVEWGGLISIEELPTIRNGPFWLERDFHFKHKEGTNYGSLETLTGI